MGERREIKHVPLHGGLQQDVGYFHVDSPTLSLADRCRFQNQTEIQKAAEPANVGNTFADPVGIVRYGAEDLAIPMVDGDVAVWDVSAATYTNVSSTFSPHVLTRLQTLENKSSAYSFGCVYYANGDRYVIYWQDFEAGSGADPVVCVETYNATTGAFINSSRDSGIAPRGANNGYVYYWSTDGTQLRYVSPSTLTDGAVSGLLGAAMVGHDHDDYASASPGYYSDLRIGFSEQYMESHVFWDIQYESNGIRGFAAYTSSTGGIRYVRLNGAFTISDDIISGGASEYVLGVDVADDSAGDAHGVVMFSSRSGTKPALSQTLYASWYNVESSPLTGYGSVVLAPVASSVHYLNGSVKRRSGQGSGGGNFLYAYTMINKDPSVHSGGKLSVVGGKTVAGVDTDYWTLDRNWRLASKIGEGADWDEFYACVQPQTLLGPYDASDRHYQHFYPGQARLDSTFLVRADNDSSTYGATEVLAQLDVGESRVCNIADSEYNVHLPGLWKSGSSWITVNRVYGSGADDASLVWEATSSTTNDDHVVLTGGSWGARLYAARPMVLGDYVDVQGYGSGAIIPYPVPVEFDGRGIHELQPLHAPELSSVRYSGNVPTSQGWSPPDPDTTDEYRVYQAVYAFTDVNGRTHRSPPSIPFYAKPGTASDAAATTLYLSSRLTVNSYPGGTVEVYSGAYGDTPKLAAVRALPTSSNEEVVVRFSDWFDTSGGAAVDVPERTSVSLYTEGGILPSDPWPDMADTIITSSRLFGISEHSTGVVYFSKPLQPGLAPEFSLGNSISLGRNRNLTAINKIDEKVILFEEDAVYAIIGNGPDAAGTNGDFIVDRLQIPFGTNDPQSVVETSDGLMFYSDISGEIHLLTRDLQLVDIGKPVSLYTRVDGLDMYKAVLVPGLSEVWFPFYDPENHSGTWGPDADAGAPSTLSRPRPRFRDVPQQGSALVYNYHYKRWSLNSSDATIGAVPYKGGFAGCGSGTNVYILDPYSEVYTQAFPADCIIRTPWIKLNGMQGMGRIQEIVLLGRYLSAFDADSNGDIMAGDIEVILNYDYEGYQADADIFRFRANNGDLGPSNGRLQLAVSPGRPQCQAVQITIKEIDTDVIDVQAESGTTYSRGPWCAWSGIDLVLEATTGTGRKSLGQKSSK